MKKKIWIPILIVAVIAILVIPIPTGTYKDGGTREYTSLTYKIVDWNRLTDDGSTYSATKVYFFPNNFRSIDNLWYKEEPKVEHTFIATILEINGTSVTVQPVENSAILMSSDKVSFGTANLEKIDVEVGSVVKVIYTGGVMESYPAKVNAKSWSLSDDLRHMEYNEQWLDTATFDIDGDGKEEQCTLSAGPTSGLFTFIFSVSENGNLEYFNIFNSPYTELQFEKNAEGIMMLVGKNDDKNCYMGMDISDGNIVISSDEQEISYWGEQGLNSPYAPKTASDLNNAIAKVLNEKYRAEDPDGLIHIENYYLLANETASGTPLKGNFGHMTKATVYLETGMLGSYRPESAIVKKSDSGAAFAVFRDSTYTLDDDTCTREREMLIKGKRFIISSVFPVKAKATATDKMLVLIDADLQKDAKSF